MLQSTYYLWRHMNENIETQALRNSVKPEVIAIVKELKLPVETLSSLMSFNLDALRALLKSDLPIEEIRHFAMENKSTHDTAFYISLRSYLSEEQVNAIPAIHRRSVRDGLEAGFTLEQMKEAVRRGVIYVGSLVKANRLGITFEEYMEVFDPETRADEYIEARSSGSSHEELLEVLRAGRDEYKSFSLEKYSKLISHSVPHAQILYMLKQPFDFNFRDHYVILMVSDWSDVTHRQALQVVRGGIHPYTYRAARAHASHSEIMQVNRSSLGLKEYADIRAQHSKLTHAQIMSYVGIPTSLRSISSYQLLLSEGVAFKDIERATSLGMSMSAFLSLLELPFRCSVEEILDVASADMYAYRYQERWLSGESHELIIENAMKKQAAEDIEPS